MRTSLKKAAGIGVLAVSIVTIGSVASAAAPEPSVNGCVGKLTGLLRIIDPAKSQRCSSLETPISWAQRGIPGPAGATGAQGPAGPAGPAGSGGALWAKVETRLNGTDQVARVVEGRHATEVFYNETFGDYTVIFDQSVEHCAPQVTLVTGVLMARARPAGDSVSVELRTSVYGNAIPDDFYLTVNC